MATGDPYCPTHRYNPCMCGVVWGGENWIGDNEEYSKWPTKQASWDLLYRPNNIVSYPVAPYIDTTETFYTWESYMIVSHDRWSRMLMEIEEHWDDMAGYKVKTSYTSTRCSTGDMINIPTDAINYSDPKITWSSST